MHHFLFFILFIYKSSFAEIRNFFWFFCCLIYGVRNSKTVTISSVFLKLLENGVEFVVYLRDLELLELDGGRIEGEPHRERELGVHQQCTLRERKFRFSEI